MRNLLMLCPALMLLLGCGEPDRSAPPPPSTASAADPAPAPETAPVALKARWTAGKRYVERVESNQRSFMTASSRPEPIPQSISSRQDYAINVVSAGDRTQLDLEFLSIAMGISQGSRQLFEFDSRKPIVDTNLAPVAASLARLVGQRLTFLTTPEHHVAEIRGTADLYQQLITNAPPQAQSILNGLISTNTLEQFVEIYHGLPSQPVRPGDEWPLELEFSIGPLGVAVLNATNTFTGWAEKNNKRCALIKYRGTIGRKADSPSTPLGGSPEIQNGTLHGQSWFDPEMGTILESATEQSMSILISFQPPQGSPKPQVITNTIVTSVTQSLVEVQDVP